MLQYFDVTSRHTAKIEIANVDEHGSVPDHDRPLVLCHFWDTYLDQQSRREHDVLHLFSRDWILIHEHLLRTQQHHRHDQCDLGQPDRFMLMLMNLIRGHRDECQIMFNDFLPDSLWTYVQRGICLPEDPIPMHCSAVPGGFDQYRYVRSWYDRTLLSMVVESRVEPWLFISEKTFKPIAHGHPFMIFGPPGILHYLKALGFATFDHVIDESYDAIKNHDCDSTTVFSPAYTCRSVSPGEIAPRLTAIYHELQKLHRAWRDPGCDILRDARTLDAIKHNTDLFYNAKFVHALFRQQIIDPILCFIENN